MIYSKTKVIEAFASPLNHTPGMKYCSIFEEDKKFKDCVGPFDSSIMERYKQNLFLCNPPFDEFSTLYLLDQLKKLHSNDALIVLPAKDNDFFSHFKGRTHSGGTKDFHILKQFFNLSSLSTIIINTCSYYDIYLFR